MSRISEDDSVRAVALDFAGEQIRHEYRNAKAEELQAYAAVTTMDSLLRRTIEVRDEVFEEIRAGNAPSLERAFVAMYGPEIASAWLRKADSIWQSVSGRLAQLLEKMDSRQA